MRLANPVFQMLANIILNWRWVYFPGLIIYEFTSFTSFFLIISRNFNNFSQHLKHTVPFSFSRIPYMYIYSIDIISWKTSPGGFYISLLPIRIFTYVLSLFDCLISSVAVVFINTVYYWNYYFLRSVNFTYCFIIFSVFLIIWLT